MTSGQGAGRYVVNGRRDRFSFQVHCHAVNDFFLLGDNANRQGPTFVRRATACHRFEGLCFEVSQALRALRGVLQTVHPSCEGRPWGWHVWYDVFRYVGLPVAYGLGCFLQVGGTVGSRGEGFWGRGRQEALICYKVLYVLKTYVTVWVCSE